MGLLGATVLATTIWRQAILALPLKWLITITHTSLSLKLCVFHLARMFFNKATVFLKMATNVVRLS